MSNPIVIAMISDRGFMMPTCVAIQSLKCNRNIHHDYRLYIFLNNCSTEDVNNLKNMEEESFEINVVELDLGNIYQKYLNENISANPTALYKFDLPNLLNDHDKVLYLDGDLLIEQDLAELYNIDIEDYFVAAVKDMPLMVGNNPQMKKMLRKSRDYFNSGVMLLNLKKMRENNCTQQLLEYKQYGINSFMDQDAFNAVFEGKALYLNIYYNLLFRVVENFGIERICNFYQVPLEDNIEGMYHNALIIHMASKYKPWKYETPYLSSKFITYYAMTPYSHTELKLEPRVPPTLCERPIPVIDSSNNFLVICENEFELFQAIRFFSLSNISDANLLLGGNLKGYIDYLAGLNIFAKIEYLSQNDMMSHAISSYDEEILHVNYRNLYMFNLNSCYSKIFFTQAKISTPPGIVCLDGGYNSLIKTFPFNSTDKYNISDYIIKWYVDTPMALSSIIKSAYIYPMPSLNFYDKALTEKLYKNTNNSFKYVFFANYSYHTEKEYSTYLNIVQLLKEYGGLVATDNDRIIHFCKMNNVPFCHEYLIPVHDIIFNNLPFVYITDHINILFNWINKPNTIVITIHKILEEFITETGKRQELFDSLPNIVSPTSLEDLEIIMNLW